MWTGGEYKHYSVLLRAVSTSQVMVSRWAGFIADVDVATTNHTTWQLSRSSSQNSTLCAANTAVYNAGARDATIPSWSGYFDDVSCAAKERAQAPPAGTDCAYVTRASSADC